ncbi:MAG TPA: hypothetical protein VFX03_13070 [Thermomicrobiales bacterium]|nr:hypothetical protein [Thermomicrobiales bacterium]
MASGEPIVPPGAIARSMARCSASKSQRSTPMTAGARYFTMVETIVSVVS